MSKRRGKTDFWSLAAGRRVENFRLALTEAKHVVRAVRKGGLPIQEARALLQMSNRDLDNLREACISPELIARSLEFRRQVAAAFEYLVAR